jgi:hypothetical protein
MVSQKIHLSRSERDCASTSSLQRTLSVRFTPQFLRAWHGRGERRSPDHGRPPEAPTIETIVSTNCFDVIGFWVRKQSGQDEEKPSSLPYSVKRTEVRIQNGVPSR